ncbi:MAG: AraC family transcriptional regulator [Pseudolabrys sp.]
MRIDNLNSPPGPAPWPRPGGPVRFSLRDAPVRERRALYHDFFGRSVMRYEVKAAQDIPLDIDVKLQELPGLLMVSGRMHGSQNCRTAACVSDGLDDLALAVNLGGKYVIAQGDREIALEDGEATLFSLGRTCSTMHWPPGRLLAMRFPRRQLSRRIRDVDAQALRRIPAGCHALTLLTGYIHIAQDCGAVASPGLRGHFADHIYDLIAAALGEDRDVGEAAQACGVRAARLQAIKRDIGGQLDRPDLSVVDFARRHSCTPRYLQRLFEMEGTTFTDYVLSQRLARAYRLLTDPRPAGGKISAVAYDCGFGDVSYFNRVFRRHYGAAPSDVRARARASAPEVAPPGGDALPHWSI